MQYTLNNPHPEHRPEVRRKSTGTSMLGGRKYATTLRCSCGWAPSVERFSVRLDGEWVPRERKNFKVSNSPPSSKEARDAAHAAYLRHINDLGLNEGDAEDEQEFTEADMLALEATLDDLEAIDPDVAAAAASYSEAISSIVSEPEVVLDLTPEPTKLVVVVPPNTQVRYVVSRYCLSPMVLDESVFDVASQPNVFEVRPGLFGKTPGVLEGDPVFDAEPFVFDWGVKP